MKDMEGSEGIHDSMRLCLSQQLRLSFTGKPKAEKEEHEETKDRKKINGNGTPLR